MAFGAWSLWRMTKSERPKERSSKSWRRHPVVNRSLKIEKTAKWQALTSQKATCLVVLTTSHMSRLAELEVFCMGDQEFHHENGMQWSLSIEMKEY